MNHALRCVLASGSVSALSICAFAQSQAVRPQYYSWEKHPVLNSTAGDPDFFEYDDRFCSMVRVILGSSTPNAISAEQAAIATKNEIQARLAEGTGTISLQNLAITIQNLGGFTGGTNPLEYQDVSFSFVRAGDAAPTFTGLNDFDPLEYRQFQPWMGTAVGKFLPNGQWRVGDVTVWMTAYCEALKLQLVGAGLSTVPVRFHFDYEGNLFGKSWNKEIIRQMIACERDSRWATAEVPGFNGQTMLQLWHAAQDEYGWKNPDGSYRLLESVLLPGQDAHVAGNNPYAQWWLNITGKALNAAFKRCVQDVIKASWPNAEVLVSNYDYANADMAVDAFGYRKVTNPAAQSLSQFQQISQRIDTTAFRRGFYSLDARGAYPRYSAVSTTGGTPLMFQMSGGVNVLDFDAPVLYYPDGQSPANNMVSHLQGRMYEPRNTNNSPVTETISQAAERTHRHNLESIINTTTRAVHGVTPWIEFPGVHWIDTSGTLNGIDQTRRQLALFRSKDIREVVLWANKVGAGARGTPSAWNAVKRADEQVYSPWIKSVELVRGVNAGTWSEQALNTTLRTTIPTVLTVEGEYAGSPSHHHVTDIVVRVHGVKPLELGVRGRLVLECVVSPNALSEVSNPSAWLASSRGQVSIWNADLEQWEPVASVNDSGTGEYRYHVEDPDSPGRGLSRREWEVGHEPGGMCSYLTNQQGDPCAEGALSFKFTQLALETPSGFRSSYDLVMFYHIDGFATLPGDPLSLSMSQSSANATGFLPADFNFDGVQDATDATLFASAWTNGERRAD
jgi:hypothetical protein